VRITILFFTLYSSAPVIEISASTFILVLFCAQFTCMKAWRPVHCPMHVTSSAIRCTWSRAPAARYRRATISRVTWDVAFAALDEIYFIWENRSLLYQLYNMYIALTIRAMQYLARNRFFNRETFSRSFAYMILWNNTHTHTHTHTCARACVYISKNKKIIINYYHSLILTIHNNT